MNHPLKQTPQDRFKVLDQPYPSPHKCVGCGVDHNMDGTRQFIDTTYELDFYGVVLLCSTCFLEIANALKYISPEQWEGIVKSSTDSLIDNERLKEENESLRLAIRTLASSSYSEPAVVLNVVADEIAPENSGALEGSTPDGVSPSPDSNEPDVSEGLPDVRRTPAAKPKPSKRDDSVNEFAELGL